MPSGYTHHFFGEDALKDLPEGIITTYEEQQAFFVGCYGPDPLATRHTTTYKRGVTVRHLSYDMHHSHMTRNFMCMREGVDHLDPDSQGIGRAYVLGFLTHWLLDSTTHPFIFAQQNAICAIDKSLAKSPSEVHSVIENDIDSWLLWTRQHQTVLDFPHTELSHRTERSTRIMGALIAYAAQNVYGVTIPATEFGYAMKDTRNIFRVIDPVGTTASKVLSRIELLFRENSAVLSHAHAIWTSDDCPAANLDHKPWSNAASGISGSESFLDLYEAALDRWPRIAECFIRGDEDALRAEIAGRNYGGLLVADV